MKLLGWLFKVSCYSLVYVRAELIPPQCDKLVFTLEQIYICYSINVSHERDGRLNHDRKENARELSHLAW